MEELTRRAVAAYFRSANGDGLDQPSSVDSGPETLDGKEYVVLRNNHGVLAVYRVRTSGALKRLRRWPAVLNQEG